MAIEFANYGQLRDVDATPEELEIYELLKEITGADDLDLVRKSDSYVTAVVDEFDVARFKYTNRAKWINFPPLEIGSTKNRIKAVDDIRDFEEKAKQAVEHARENFKKYGNR